MCLVPVRSELGRSFSLSPFCTRSPGFFGGDGIDFSSVCSQFRLMFGLWPSHFLTINSLLMRAAAHQIVSRLFSAGWGRSAPYEEVGSELVASPSYRVSPSEAHCQPKNILRVAFSKTVNPQREKSGFPYSLDYFILFFEGLIAFSRSFCHMEQFLVFL